jgi:hypothetical protein
MSAEIIVGPDGKSRCRWCGAAPSGKWGTLQFSSSSDAAARSPFRRRVPRVTCPPVQCSTPWVSTHGYYHDIAKR